MTVGPSRYVKKVTEKAILLRARSRAEGLNFAEVKGETAEQIDPIFLRRADDRKEQTRGHNFPHGSCLYRLILMSFGHRRRRLRPPHDDAEHGQGDEQHCQD